MNKPLLRTLLILPLLWTIVASAAPAAQAQQHLTSDVVQAAVATIQQDAQTRIKVVADELEKIKGEYTKANDDDNQLSLLKLRADAVLVDIQSATTDLQSRYDTVSKRLTEIGPPPDDPNSEDKKIADDRKRLQDEKAQMNTVLSDADALKTEISRVSGDISNRRRDLFAETLFRRTQITGDLVQEALQAAQDKSLQFVSAATSASQFTWNFKRGSLLAVLGISFAIALLLILPVRRAFAHLLFRDPNAVNPRYFERLTMAFWSVLAPAAAIATFLLTFLILLLIFKVLREDMAQLLASVGWAIVGVYFMWKLSRAVFAPGKPQWRLVNLSDRGATQLVFFTTLLAFINAVSFTFTTANKVLDAPVSLTVLKGSINSLLIGAVLIAMSFIRPMAEKGEGEAKGYWPSPMKYGLLGVGVGLIGAVLLGYIGLAQFVSTQVIVTGAIAVTLYIGFLSGQAISRRDAFAQTRLGGYIKRRYGFDEMRMDQVGLIVGLLVYGAIFFFGLPLILLQWGFRVADIAGLFVQLFTEIHIGSISISLVGIFAGVLVFFVGLFGSRWFQRWLDGNVLARSQIDQGARNSVNTALGYAGVVIAALVGISAAGVDLSSFALIASALSLGIGFGLQTIVSNFVSGLILLAERPFRVGDWIVNGPVEGFVRRISVRATEIETFRNQTVIVPNSQLINAAVGNWTLRNKLGRSEIPVSVSYDADPRHVMDILLQVARNQPLVLTMPEPHVEFVRFGDSSLDFELRFYLADLFTGLGVRNQIRIEILERFREEGIDIPFPQRNLTVQWSKDGEAKTARKADPADGRENAARLDERRAVAEAAARDIDAVPDNRHSHDRYDHDDDADDGGDELSGR